MRHQSFGQITGYRDKFGVRTVSLAILLCLAVVAMPLLFAVTSNADPTFTEFNTQTKFTLPGYITTGPDGALWTAANGQIGRITTSGQLSNFPVPNFNGFTDSLGGITTGPDGSLWVAELLGTIDRVTTSGVITKFAVPQQAPRDIVAGPDGALWVTSSSNDILRMNTAGTVTNEYVVPTANSSPYDITVGSDGALWFTESNSNINKIGRITTSGVFSEYQISTPTAAPFGITAGSDGALWFTEEGASKIGRITTSGSITEFPIQSNSGPEEITAGPDGALWFDENNTNKIGRITTSGSYTQYAKPTANSGPAGITTGPDGAIWFTEGFVNKIARISLNEAPPVTTASLSPNANSDGTYPNPVSVTLTATPSAGFSVAHTYYALDGGAQQTYNSPFSVSGIGSHTLTFWSVDNVGVTETMNSKSFTLVNPAPSAPTNLAVPSPTQNPALTWNAVSGATSYNIYRDGSKIDSSTTNSYTDNNASEGTHSYYVTAVNSGGESSPSNTVSSVLVDRTAPGITYTVTPVTDNNGFNTGNVTVTFNCTDNSGGSGIASCTSPVTVPDEGIGHVVSGTATDNAGNTTMVNANASLLVSAINAGGNNSGDYAADTNFTGGQAYSEGSNATVDTAQVTVMPANQDVYQSSRYGNMSYTFSGLTPGSNYTLRLHFNELYWGTAGQSGGVGSRVFNVDVNGNPALSNFDIYKTAGGANKAIVEELPTTADSNGNVTVQFTNVTDNALVNGLELYQGTLPAEPPAPTIPPVTSADIAAGSNTAIGNFSADTDFSGGQAYISSDPVDTSNATNPAPQAVYQSDRYGNFTYTVPNLTPDTNFLVRLHFNEPYWGADGRDGGVGSRLFDVSINGNQVLTNFDVYASAGGANEALTEDFTATSDSSGNVSIQFTGVTDNAMVSGIEIEPID